MSEDRGRTVLVVEPDPHRRMAIVEMLVAADRAVIAVGTASAAVAASGARSPIAVVVGAVGGADRELLEQLREPGCEIIEVADGHGTHDRVAEMILRSSAAEVDVTSTHGESSKETLFDSHLIGAHPSMEVLMAKALQAGHSDATVLIEGETGTGKAEVAAYIHASSRRRARPLVRVNCAALAPTLLESELFGHEKGAFTGAVARRRGFFERAHEGTLFLDEIGEIPAEVQVKLLRFLQERAFERVGGNETVHVSVRIIAATNRDLGFDVEQGTFRKDLYYRLNVIRLEVPPLRARPADIPALAQHFLRTCDEREGRVARTLSAEAMRALLAYGWPGNVRELENAIEHAAVSARGDAIDATDFPPQIGAGAASAPRLLVPGITLLELERYAILRTLDAVAGSTSKASRLLGISRRKIQYRLEEWGLDRYGRDRDDDGSEPPPAGYGARPPPASAPKRRRAPRRIEPDSASRRRLG